MVNKPQDEDKNKLKSYGAVKVINDNPAQHEADVAGTGSEDDGENKPLLSVSQRQQRPPAHHSFIGITFVMLGAFSFSVMFLLVKLMEGTADAFTLVFYRSLVQMVISLASIIQKGENPFGPNNLVIRFWLCVRGGFGAGAVIAWFFGIQNLPLPDAVTLQFTTPPFAAMFAVCLVKEKWLPLDMIGAIVCLMGVALIAHPTWLFGDHETADEAAAAAAAAAAASSTTAMKAIAVLVTTGGAALAGIAYVSVRLIGHSASANVMVFYYAVLSIPIVLVGSYYLEGNWNVWGDGTFSVKDYFLLLLMGFAGYGGQFFTNLGLQKETAATATLATSTQIVWTYIFELAFLHEPINAWSLSGTGLILGYMLYVGHLKMKASTIQDNDPVAGETEAEGMLYSSERHHGPVPGAEKPPQEEQKEASDTLDV